MNGDIISADLVSAARLVNDLVGRNMRDGGPVMHSALLVSQLHDAIKTDLAATPPHRRRTVSALSAALCKCGLAAVHVDRPRLMDIELKAAISILESAWLEGVRARYDVHRVTHTVTRAGTRPRLRLIK